MKVMIRRNSAGVLSAYIAKKDLEEPIVNVEKEPMWGGRSRWRTAGSWSCRPWVRRRSLPITVEARRLSE